MTYGELKETMRAYLARTSSAFEGDAGLDLLGVAINGAKLWAMRKHDFEFARTEAVIKNFDYAEGGLLSSALPLHSTDARIKVKTIESAYLPFTDGLSFFPARVISKAAFVEERKRAFASILPSQANPGQFLSTSGISLVRHGDRLFISPADSATLGAEKFELRMDVVAFPKDYKDDKDTDFFLEFCHDFIRVRTLFELNLYLQEDDRLPVSSAALTDSWRSMLQWDSTLTDGDSDDYNLD